jgi:hypothetical protein
LTALIGKVGRGFLTAGLAKLNKEHSLSIGFPINGGEMVKLVIPFVGFAPDILDLEVFLYSLA